MSAPLRSWVSGWVGRLKNTPHTSPEYADLMSVIPNLTYIVPSNALPRVTIALLQTPNVIEYASNGQNPESAMGLGKLIGISASFNNATGMRIREDFTREVSLVLNGFCPESESREENISRAIGTAHKIGVRDPVGLAERYFKALEKRLDGGQLTEFDIKRVIDTMARVKVLLRMNNPQHRYAPIFLQLVNRLVEKYPTRDSVKDLQTQSVTLLPRDKALHQMKQQVSNTGAHMLPATLTSMINEDAATEDILRVVEQALKDPEGSFAGIRNFHISIMGRCILARLQTTGDDDPVVVGLRDLSYAWWKVKVPENDTGDDMKQEHDAIIKMLLVHHLPNIPRDEVEETISAACNMRHTNLKPIIRALRYHSFGEGCIPIDALKERVESVLLRDEGLFKQELLDLLPLFNDIRFPLSPLVCQVISNHMNSVDVNAASCIDAINTLCSHVSGDSLDECVRPLLRKFSQCAPAQVEPTNLAVFLKSICQSNVGITKEVCAMCENILAENEKSNIHLRASELASLLMITPHVLESGKTHFDKTKEGRNLIGKFMDSVVRHMLDLAPIDNRLILRVSAVTSALALANVPGRNVNNYMRPLLRHMVQHHTFSPATLEIVIRIISGYTRRSRLAAETRRMMPLINFMCNLGMRHKDMLTVGAAIQGAHAIVRRGSVIGDPINPAHRAFLRVCGNVLFREGHEEALAKAMAEFHDKAFIAEMLSHSMLFDTQARKVLLRIATEEPYLSDERLGILSSDRSLHSLLWAVARGEMLSIG